MSNSDAPAALHKASSQYIEGVRGRLRQILNERYDGYVSRMARKLSITRPTLKRTLTKPGASVDARLIYEICEAAGYRIEWVATGEGEPRTLDKAIRPSDVVLIRLYELQAGRLQPTDQHDVASTEITTRVNDHELLAAFELTRAGLPSLVHPRADLHLELLRADGAGVAFDELRAPWRDDSYLVRRDDGLGIMRLITENDDIKIAAPDPWVRRSGLFVLARVLSALQWM